MSGRPGCAGARFRMIRPHSAAIPVETDAHAALTVGDVTAVDWLSPGCKGARRRHYARPRHTLSGFTGDAGQLSAGRAVTRFWPLRPRPPYLGSLLGDRRHGGAGLWDTEGTRFSTGPCGWCGLPSFLAR
jgi:hypothetical protein